MKELKLEVVQFEADDIMTASSCSAQISIMTNEYDYYTIPFTTGSYKATSTTAAGGKEMNDYSEVVDANGEWGEQGDLIVGKYYHYAYYDEGGGMACYDFVECTVPSHHQD